MILALPWAYFRFGRSGVLCLLLCLDLTGVEVVMPNLGVKSNSVTGSGGKIGDTVDICVMQVVGGRSGKSKSRRLQTDS